MNKNLIDSSLNPNIAKTYNAVDPDIVSQNLYHLNQIQQILQEDYQVLEVLTQVSSLAVIELHSNGNVKIWNSAAEKIFGWKREEVINQPFLITHEHKEKQDKFLFLREQILSGKDLNGIELHYQKKDGSPIDISIFTVHTSNTIVIIVDDITKYKRIERKLSTQYAVTRILAESITLNDAIPKILEVICKCFEWEICTFWSLDHATGLLHSSEIWHIPSIKLPDFNEITKRITFSYGVGLPGRVWASRSPLWIIDISKDPKFLRLPAAVREGLRSAFGFPILVMGKVFGVIDSFSREIQEPDQNLLEMLATFGSQIGQFIERRLAEENRAQLLSQILVAQEQERKRIARELHDETGQSLTALLVGLKVIEMTETLENAQTQAKFLSGITSQTVKNLKRLSQGLHPNILEDLGLIIALNRYVVDYITSYGIFVETVTKNLDQTWLTFTIEIVLYRIVQEALTNIAKHSQAKKVKIIIESTSSSVNLKITDDGCGFNVESTLRTAAIYNHLGLYSMCERVKLLAGSIVIKSKTGKGTKISIQIPVKNDKPEQEIKNL